MAFMPIRRFRCGYVVDGVTFTVTLTVIFDVTFAATFAATFAVTFTATFAATLACTQRNWLPDVHRQSVSTASARKTVSDLNDLPIRSTQILDQTPAMNSG